MDGKANRIIRWILLLAVCISTQAAAQEKMDFRQIDSCTYKAYLEKRWGDILDTFEISKGLGIDYYYLRMRAGIASYEQTKYRAAIRHFEKALEFNVADPSATYYLQKSYMDGGFIHQAIWMNADSVNHPKLFTAVMPEMGINLHPGFGDLKVKYEKPTEGRNLYLEKELSGPFRYYSLTFVHELSPRWKIDHTFGVLQMEKYRQVQYDNYTLLQPTGHIVLENAYQSNQFSWYISPKYYPEKNRENVYFLHTFLLSAKSDEYLVKGVMMPPVPPPGSDPPSPLNYLVETNTTNYRQAEFAAGLILKKHHTLFSRELHGSFYKGDQSFRLQLRYTFVFYPAGRSSFSSATSAYGMLGQGSGFVFKQEFRIKPVRFIDISLYGIMGNMAFFSDREGLIVYNLPDPVRLKAGINVYAQPVKRLGIMVGYSMTQSSTEFLWKDFAGIKNHGEIMFNTSVQSYKFINHLIFGGILWAF